MTAVVLLGFDRWPWLGLLTVGLIVGWWVGRTAERRRRRLLLGRDDRLLGYVASRRLRSGLAFGAVAAAGLALLRPAFEGNSVVGAPDVVLCLDVSRSMAAADVAPSRFAAAQAAVHAACTTTLGSNLALVAFAGEAKLLAPLTKDAAAIDWLAAELAAGAVRIGGSDPGAAIAVAAQCCERVGARGDLVLLTDGEDFVGGAGPTGGAVVAARRAAAAGHRVHALGFGEAAGSKILVGDGDTHFLRDASGEEIVTRLEVERLGAVAAAGGGEFRCARDEAALTELLRDVARVAARRAAPSASGEGGLIELWPWCLWLCLSCWMLRLWWPERVR